MIPQSRITATAQEHALELPGDELIPNAVDTLTHAITVQCSPIELWPWLAQMGADRAGWYSYDWIDNGGHRSAGQVMSELQHPPVGTIFPGVPDCKEGFVLLEKETNHWLVLGWPSENGGYAVTWAFLLRAAGENRTRLIVRVRAANSYRFGRLPHSLSRWLARLVHFVMQRKQLVEIVSRAERLAS